VAQGRTWVVEWLPTRRRSSRGVEDACLECRLALGAVLVETSERVGIQRNGDAIAAGDQRVRVALDCHHGTRTDFLATCTGCTTSVVDSMYSVGRHTQGADLLTRRCSVSVLTKRVLCLALWSVSFLLSAVYVIVQILCTSHWTLRACASKTG
jgi:hypothetical protein